MALNLNDRLAILRSGEMQARCAAAVANFALYLLGGTPTDEQLAWAREAIRAPESFGSQVSYYVLSDPNFLGSGAGSITGDTWVGGSDITDDQLKGACETAINSYFIAAAE